MALAVALEFPELLMLDDDEALRQRAERIMGGPGGARRVDPVTSHAAAREMNPDHRQIALDAIKSAGSHGLTASELEEATGVNGIWRRLSELEQAGLTKPTDETRKGASGRQQRVHVAV